MPFRKSLFSIVYLLSTLLLQAQMSGVIIDSNSGKPVKGCEVFVNNSSLFTTTNSDGQFELSAIPIGFYDLVIYNEKYEIFKSPLQVKVNKAYKLTLSITPLSEKSKSSRAKQDEEWINNMNWFRQGLLGSTSFTPDCTIENERSISFEREGYELKATASEPLRITNNALGYSITYYLQSFNATDQAADMQGLLKFDTLSSPFYSKKKSWDRNRQIAYWGTSRHLFQSLVARDFEIQGFELTDGTETKLNNDSLVRPSRIEGYFNINLPSLTQVKYTINSGLSGMQGDNQNGQHSRIKRLGSIDVNSAGLLLSDASVQIEGELIKSGLASAVPINYSPDISIADEKLDWQNFALLQEKVYLHTDRDYYYPRETIWFKAYLGFSMPILRDTLSRLLYVDLISPSGEVLARKNVKIRNGIGWGEFVLPPILLQGEYYLRAYTNWMRNYKDSLYVRPVPILGWEQNLVSNDVTDSENNSKFKVTITTDKTTYKTREKISLSIAVELPDQLSKTVAGNMSITVVDAQASAEIPQIENILTPGLLSIGKVESKNEYFESIEHFMERGISFRGTVVDPKNNPVNAFVDIVQGNMDNLINLETDDKGEFLVTGLDFMDSLNFAFKSTNAKGKLFGKVKLIKKDIPRFSYTKPTLTLNNRSDNALQRVQNTYALDKNTILLNEVVITDKAIKKEAKIMPKIYGRPDYTVKGADMRGAIAGSNPLITLQGRVPGLQVTEYFDNIGIRHTSVKIRGGTSSMAGNTDPLIMVDGMIWGGPDDLMGLTPSSIDYVEVITRGVSMFGSRGANGVIAIYTKKGVEDREFQLDYDTYKIGGYTRPLQFLHPDYSQPDAEVNPDFRTTIYWNPDVTAGSGNSATVEFYSADVETKYRVIVEGITTEGKPFRGQTFITITR